MATSNAIAFADLKQAAGRHLGYTDWEEMSQERVNEFADATNDHQFIHVDVQRAKQTPFGGTIAHGYLSLSLMAYVMGQLMHVSERRWPSTTASIGCVSPAPLPVGKQWRGGAEILEVTRSRAVSRSRARARSRCTGKTSRPASPRRSSGSTAERRR